MKEHLKETAKKVGNVTRNLVRLIHAPTWCKTMEVAKYRKIYEGVQRQMAIRVSSVYRTVSTVIPQLLVEQSLQTC